MQFSFSKWRQLIIAYWIHTVGVSTVPSDCCSCWTTSPRDSGRVSSNCTVSPMQAYPVSMSLSTTVTKHTLWFQKRHPFYNINNSVDPERTCTIFHIIIHPEELAICCCAHLLFQNVVLGQANYNYCCITAAITDIYGSCMEGICSHGTVCHQRHAEDI